MPSLNIVWTKIFSASFVLTKCKLYPSVPPVSVPLTAQWYTTVFMWKLFYLRRTDVTDCGKFFEVRERG